VLVNHFLGRLNARFGQSRRIAPAAMDALVRYPWPGNVREILHTIEQAVILSDAELIDVEHLPAELKKEPQEQHGRLLSLREVERQHIVRVLEAMGGNRGRAARLLGISERTLYRKLNEYDLA
jgi:DNA-binding NtrC family response regulator